MIEARDVAEVKSSARLEDQYLSHWTSGPDYVTVPRFSRITRMRHYGHANTVRALTRGYAQSYVREVSRLASRLRRMPVISCTLAPSAQCAQPDVQIWPILGPARPGVLLSVEPWPGKGV